MKLVMLLSFVPVAFAQTATTSSGVISSSISATGATAQRVVMPNGMVSFGSAGPGMLGAAVVGEPYSAEQITEHVQTLADGTRITQPERKAMFYRDSQGRTRTEHTVPLGDPRGNPPSFIEINDPVSGVHYMLNPHERTARKMTFPREVPPPPPPSGSAEGAIRTLPARVSSAKVLARQSTSAADNREQRPQFTHESLGSQVIEGVLADGERTTVVYPIGFFGNDRPITTVNETWTSPELKMMLLSKTSDPRNGESTMKLTNISRTEPDAALFQVPSDYQVIEPQQSAPNQ